MTPHFTNVHNQFKLNGFHLDRDDLCRVAYSFIKEGEDFEKPVGEFLLDWFDEKPYIEMQTSGSTGLPKIIQVDKQAMVHSALATGDFFDLKPGDRALQCLPVKYVAGKMMLIRSIVLGLDLDYVAPTSHPMERLEDKYDFAAMVPLQAQCSIPKLTQIKKLIVGGARINAVLEQQLMQLPTQVFETYGMTETITHIAAKRVGEKAFTVLPHVTISYDERNCLVIHAPHIIAEETVVTNDLVELVNENQFVFLGRIDNVINSGGVKILPEQVEHKLDGKLDRRFFISSEEDTELGDKVVLIVEGEPFEISPKIFDRLDKYERPKTIHFIPHFAETENGKIIRKASLLK
ncbi:AMP-binding protein [Flavobacterium sp.]|jgi:O-succinylbenzoic acid--CoA ligase|uniref:AMP-binding protein n=2 Tax=Flavobacterium sp. TaxID=239 RepID=UPI0022CA72D5|nr:AMP-binding protein [Flavobacterium sp.]MCZ8144986.1 AMP-binding protein [Flavobacterium sp.]MCZ8368268.1 AMP-binding protein [Flavobacterium sp.]